MKPILILRINVGPECGGIIPLKIFYNDDAYFKQVTDNICRQFPLLNETRIRDMIYAQIKSGVVYSIEKHKQSKQWKKQKTQQDIESSTFDELVTKNTGNEGEKEVYVKKIQKYKQKSRQQSDCNQDAFSPFTTFQQHTSNHYLNQNSNLDLSKIGGGGTDEYINLNKTLNSIPSRSQHQRILSMQVPPSVMQNQKLMNESIQQEDNISDTNESSLGYNSEQKKRKAYQISNDQKSDKFQQQTQATSNHDYMNRIDFYNQNDNSTTLNQQEQLFQRKYLLNIDPISDENGDGDITEYNVGQEFTPNSLQGFSPPNFLNNSKQLNFNNTKKKSKKSRLIQSRSRSPPQKQNQTLMQKKIRESVNRLYNHSREKENRINQKRNALSLEKLKQEESEVTFQPQINKKSVEMLKDRNQRHQNLIFNQTIQVISGHQSPENKRMGSPQQYSQKDKQMIDSKIKEQQQRITFQPKILEKSKRLVEEKRSQSRERTPIHLQLYQQAKELDQKRDLMIQKHREKEIQQFSSPKNQLNNKITITSRDIENQDIPNYCQRSRERKQAGQQCGERLYQEQKKLTEAKEKQRIEHLLMEETIDKTTGQNLFKPKITRGPNNEKHVEIRQKLDICTRLYYHMYIQQFKQCELELREYQKLKESANKKFMSSNSQRLFEKMQLRKLKELFDDIDGDQDGEISENSFIRAELNPQTMAFLRPLIKSGKKLDFQEFIEQLQKLLNTTNREPFTNYLMNRKRQKSPFKMCNDIVNRGILQ